MIMWGQPHSKNRVGAFQISYLMCFWLLYGAQTKQTKLPIFISYHLML